jgi:hypothetical protein
MQNGFNVDDTPAYIKVAKGAAGNAAVQLPQEPAYTPPPETDYFAQQFSPDMFQTEPTPSYGGYGRDLDDRYYEQMFAKGGLIDLLRRR